MLQKSGELPVVADWRWNLLFGLALLLLVGGMLKGYGRVAQGPRSLGDSPKSWRELGLRWELEGPRGQGIYSRSGQGILLAVTPGAGEEDVDATLGEPRLALFTAGPLDLNRIDFDTLRVLKGVGPKMAAAIIAHRRKHGPFQRIEELLEVKGVGPAKLKLLRLNLALPAVASLRAGLPSVR